MQDQANTYYTFSKLLLCTATHPRPIYSRHNLRDSSTQRSETSRKYCLPLQPCRFDRPTFRHLLPFFLSGTSEGDPFAELAIVRGTILAREAIESESPWKQFHGIVNNRSREKCVPPNYCFPCDASVNFLTTLYGEYRDPWISISRHVSAIEKSLLQNFQTFLFSSRTRNNRHLVR